MTSAADLAHLDADQLRTLAARLMAEMRTKQATIDKLTHEMAVLKRIKFAATSEAYTGCQQRLLFETIDADLEALQAEIDQADPGAADQREKQQPKRVALPANLPRRAIIHEPESTTCRCGCQLQRIGEDIAEKLDYQPGVFTVERHVRGKWVCRQCETLVQAPVAPHIIDKGIPTAGLLAHVLVAKYADHQPLYRQSGIFGRAGMAIPDSTLAQWVGRCGVQLQPLVDAMREALLRETVLHADETPVAMLKPGHGKTHRAYLWSYCSTGLSAMQAVVFDFAETRAGSMPVPSWEIGAARWCATTSAATRHCSSKASPKPAAWRTRGASSTNCGPTTRARSPGTRSSCLVRCTTSSGKRRNWMRTSGASFASNRDARRPTYCMRGCWRNGSGCRMVVPRPRRSITA
jgi:transposase